MQDNIVPSHLSSKALGTRLRAGREPGTRLVFTVYAFSYPEPFLRAVNGARQGALAKSISNWHLIGYNEGYCSNNVYILLPCFYGIRFWIWPEPLVAPRVRRALGTRMLSTVVIYLLNFLNNNNNNNRLYLKKVLQNQFSIANLTLGLQI